jgi:hypothetical protein
MAQEMVQLGLYQGPMPPLPYPVPPEDASLWTDEDIKIFEEWCKWVAKGNKMKFRRFLIQVNREHSAIYELIADGLWGLRRLLAFSESFPEYNLDKDLEFMYQDNEVDSVAVKKLVAGDLEIVHEELLLEQQQPLESVPEQEQQQPAKECQSEPDSQLSKSG